MKKYSIEFDDHKVAKWNYIQELYAIDSVQHYRVTPRLTKTHIEAKGLTSMRVKFAAQVLSHSVAAGLSLLVATKHLPSEAIYTADFVAQMDELFDSFNSRSLSDIKELRAAVCANSIHIEMWQQKCIWIQSWHFIKSDNKRITPACKKGWIITINAVIQLWKYLCDEGQKYLFTNRLNQDCLENTFSSVRRNGGFRNNPDCMLFQFSIHAVISHNLIKSSRLTNCEDDGADVLAAVFQLSGWQ